MCLSQAKYQKFNIFLLIAVLITAGLGIRSNFRFKRLLKLSQNLKNNHTVVEKLSYFKDMNIYLTCVLFSYGISLCTLCVDGLTENKVVNHSKFASDLLISNCNAAAILMWIVSVSNDVYIICISYSTKFNKSY